VIDLQAQQEGEGSKAYRAYLAYRDLGDRRTPARAYQFYLERTGGGRPNSEREGPPQVSSSFKRWVIDFNWEARIRDWDSRLLVKIQEQQIGLDRQGYLDQLEKTRAQLDRTARLCLDVAELQLSIGRTEGSRFARIAAIRPLEKEEVLQLGEIARICKVSIDSLAAARVELFCAMGVEDLQELLKRLEVSGGNRNGSLGTINSTNSLGGSGRPIADQEICAINI
jgi:hypothetical protein